ncbi:LOW QUALITY PROTEIN: hypothetical protein CRUP_011960 [Coryphaenoides rupestris]|nr:LOW QUALITY PROTEIN: hypothetical protein CRUP_011960 [Coryphaenoides rupestris]
MYPLLVLWSQARAGPVSSPGTGPVSTPGTEAWNKQFVLSGYSAQEGATMYPLLVLWSQARAGPVSSPGTGPVSTPGTEVLERTRDQGPLCSSCSAAARSGRLAGLAGLSGLSAQGSSTCHRTTRTRTSSHRFAALLSAGGRCMRTVAGYMTRERTAVAWVGIRSKVKISGCVLRAAAAALGVRGPGLLAVDLEEEEQEE